MEYRRKEKKVYGWMEVGEECQEREKQLEIKKDG